MHTLPYFYARCLDLSGSFATRPDVSFNPLQRLKSWEESEEKEKVLTRVKHPLAHELILALLYVGWAGLVCIVLFTSLLISSTSLLLLLLHHLLNHHHFASRPHSGTLYIFTSTLPSFTSRPSSRNEVGLIFCVVGLDIFYIHTLIYLATACFFFFSILPLVFFSCRTNDSSYST